MRASTYGSPLGYVRTAGRSFIRAGTLVVLLARRSYQRREYTARVYNYASEDEPTHRLARADDRVSAVAEDDD